MLMTRWVCGYPSELILFNPIGMVLGTGTRVLTGLLGAGAANRIPSLLRIMIAAGRSLDTDDYNKWKNVILAALALRSARMTFFHLL